MKLKSMQYCHLYAGILFVLLCMLVVNSETIIDGETNSDDVVHPLTLENKRHSRNKRNVDCSGLECRSLCPWSWVSDSQDGREPRFIFKAQCTHQSCDFDFADVGQRTRRKLQILTECDLVYTDIKVWQDGYPTWIPWPIACACSRARSRTVMRLGDGIVMSEFNRHSQPSTGLRAIDSVPEDIEGFDAADMYDGDDEVRLMPGRRFRHQNN